ncbi:uncharacterized protein N7496_004541 [Penicillium cataractarum]|uniref:Uncharacterized protein n=1 Tax=Penicillium cataractarum TaxID=2100454 RepID=A0A9W9SFF4_9EURO|nr:uncharacterized protein N7496_004541 [Penicillium cataractarum]KAJ5377132.1 hypothetical protein N7496_004541 [Penicillium cataractarum]
MLQATPSGSVSEVSSTHPNDTHGRWHTLPKKKPSRWQQLILDTWILECLLMIFSLGCLVAICSVLLAYDNKTRPDMKYGLSLNAIISTLATASKSSLVFVVGEAIGQLKWIWLQTPSNRQLLDVQTFDSASRGPLGSLVLLFHHGGRSLVSIGAFVLLCMLAFDPFIQQILSYPAQSTEKPGAYAPQLRDYSLVLPDLEGTMNIAVISGIWKSGFPIEPTCPSGNCTFPTFQTVGICSRCANITSNVTLDCHKPKLSGERGSVAGACNVIPDQGTPSNSLVTVNDAIDEWQQKQILKFAKEFNMPLDAETQTISMPADIVWSSNGYDSDANSTDILHEGILSPLLTVAHASLDFDFNRTTPGGDPRDGIVIKQVTECSLSLCLKNYDISIVNGKLHSDISTLSYGREFTRTADVPSPENCWMPEHDIPQEWLSEEGVAAASEFVSCGAFAVPFPQGTETQIFIYNSSSVMETGSELEATDEVVSKIAYLGLEAIMSNVADSLTKVGLDNANFVVNGTVSTLEVFVHVDWIWLAFPALLVILGNMFLVLTIIVNKKKKCSLWKSSIMAIFFHGLAEVEHDEYQTNSRMETMGEGLEVRLEFSDRNGRLMLQRQF